MDRIRLVTAVAVSMGLAACTRAQPPAQTPAQAPAPAAAFGLTAAEVAAKVAETKDGLATYRLPTGAPGPATVVARRLKTGDAEVHDAVNDIMMGKSGTATVLVGGTISGQKLTTPGEWRGGTIEGAKSYSLNPGDVVWIPAGVPHHVIVPEGAEVTYLAFKSAK